MTGQEVSQAPSTVSRIPDPREPLPAVAKPTIVLLAAGLAVWVAASVLYLNGELAWWATILINAAASYMLFTVAHDAAEKSLSHDGRAQEAGFKTALEMLRIADPSVKELAYPDVVALRYLP